MPQSEITQDGANIKTGVFFALAAAIGLGAITTQAKLFFAEGGNAYTLIFFRMLFSILLIGSIVMVKRFSFSAPSEIRWPLFWLGFIWSGSMVLYILSVQSISVSIAVILLYTYPVIVLIYAMITGQLEISVRLVSVFLIAFIGLCLALFSGDVVLEMGGVLLAAMAGVGSAFTFIKGAVVAPKINPVVMTFWINAVGLAMIIPLIVGQFSLPETVQGNLALTGATLCYIAAILCQFQALAKLPAARAAFILNLEPIVSMVLAALILSERLTLLQGIGALMVLAMLYYSSTFRFRQID